MPKKKDRPTETNPEKLPEFTPNETVEASEDDRSRALTTVHAMLDQVTTMDAEIKLIKQFMDMPNTGEQALIKTYGLIESARFLAIQYKKIELLMAEVITQIHEHNLWRMLSDFNGYDTEQHFWEDAGWDWSAVMRIANFTRHVKPMLEAADINVEEFYEETSPKAMVQATRIAQDLKRQIPELKSAKPGATTLDDDTKAASRNLYG